MCAVEDVPSRRFRFRQPIKIPSPIRSLMHQIYLHAALALLLYCTSCATPKKNDVAIVSDSIQSVQMMVTPSGTPDSSYTTTFTRDQRGRMMPSRSVTLPRSGRYIVEVAMFDVKGKDITEAFRKPSDSQESYTIEWQVGGAGATLGPADPKGGASMFDTRVGVTCPSQGRVSLLFRLRYVKWNLDQTKILDGPTVKMQTSTSIDVR